MMGFLREFFGSGKTEVTAAQMAKVAHQAALSLAFRSDGSAHEMLRSAGVNVEEDNKYQVELIVYELFLIDVIINRVFGEQSQQIREHLRQQFAELTGEFLSNAGLDPGDKRERIDILEQRFTEYMPALRRSMESDGQPEKGFLALPEAACRNILGPENVSLAAKSALASQWPVVMEQISKAFEQYEVLDAS